MGILAFTGFELGDSGENGGTGGTYSFQTSIKRTGEYALRTNPTTTNIGYVSIRGPNTVDGLYSNIFSTTTNHRIRFYFYIATLPASNNEEFFNSGGTSYFNIRVNSSGNILAYSSTTLLATSGSALSTGQWYKIDVERLSTGWAVKVDGSTWLSGGNDYRTHFHVYLGKLINRNSQSVDFYFDDVCLTEDLAMIDYDGIVLLKPDSAGTYSNFSGTYSDVSEIPSDGATTVITSTASGNKSTFNLQSLSNKSIAGATVHAVMAFAKNCRYTSPSNTHTLILRSGSTDVSTDPYGTTFNSYNLFGLIRSTDPNTSLAWTESGVNAMETGIGHIAGVGGGVKCTSTGAIILYKNASGALPIISPIVSGKIGRLKDR